VIEPQRAQRAQREEVQAAKKEREKDRFFAISDRIRFI